MHIRRGTTRGPLAIVHVSQRRVCVVGGCASGVPTAAAAAIIGVGAACVLSVCSHEMYTTLGRSVAPPSLSLTNSLEAGLFYSDMSNSISKPPAERYDCFFEVKS